MQLVFINADMKSNRINRLEYSFGEVAEKLGISTGTVRLYERQGLIIVRKSTGSQRVYSEEDMTRLKCVRAAINEHKLSIEGIRRMQSLVPCWSHVGCPEQQRAKCPAFLRTSGGCWTFKHDGNRCTQLDCRECKVYLLSGACENIKSLIYGDILPLRENHIQQEDES